MTVQKSRSTSKKILSGVIAAVTILLLLSAISLTQFTLIDPWIPFAASAAIALLSGLAAWKMWIPLTLSERFVWNFLCHFLVVGSVLVGAFFILNFALADRETARKEPAVVERRYRETRYHSRRVSRRVYTRGEPYTVHCLDLRLVGSGRKLTLDNVDYSKYRRTRTGDTVQVRIAKGAFGAPVVVRAAADLEVPQYKRATPPNPFMKHYN